MSTFHLLCETIQEIREIRGSIHKISVCIRYLKSLESDKYLELAAQFMGEGAFSSKSGKKASIGSRTVGLAASRFCEIDYDLVFKPSRTATGSNSETIGRLMENIPAAIEKRDPACLSLIEVQDYFERLRKASSRAQKEEILHEMWSKMTPVEIKYSIRMLGQGSLRIGFETKSLVSAIGKAFECDREEIRYAHMITGSIGKTAVLAKHNKLDEASFKLFHPLSFMLASPLENRSVVNFEEYLAEEKFDGMRAQIHADRENVKIFSRDLNDITPSFPDIAEFFLKRNAPPVVLDGEICGFKENSIMPFQMLQKRMGLKKPGKKILREVPVLFVAYDLLYLKNEPVFERLLIERRGMLEKIADEFEIPTTTQYEISEGADIDILFDRALKHGNEGLMLKKKESRYEYGQRGKSWLKVKKPGGSFDTVIMYAHAGSGKRGGLYSDFTLGISVLDDERYEEEFIPIGKAYGGYSNDELKMLNNKIKELTIEKYGPTLGLVPGIVIEIEFDDIRLNKRTKAGYTLRFPRFRRIRWDLAPSDVNTLRDVESYFNEKMNMKRTSQQSNPSFRV
jgi:DNA ligase 1